MKKFFSAFALMAACAALAVSCGDDTKNENDGQDGTPSTVNYRVASFSLVGDNWADVYQYTYNADGKVTRIFREEGKDYSLTYSGKTITMNNAGKLYATMELNDAGYVTKITDEWGDVREYVYDSKGHMTQVKKNGTEVSKIVIDAECIVSWTRTQEEVLQTKTHTYTSKPNTFGIHNIHSEATDPSRWLYETGLFGKSSVYLCATSKWGHSETTATYTYEVDANGCVIKESKNYGGDMEYFAYTWEKIK